MALNSHEQKILKQINNFLTKVESDRDTVDAAGNKTFERSYYSAIPRIQKFMDLPENYTKYQQYTPSYLVYLNPETNLIDGYTESGLIDFQGASSYGEIKEYIDANYPECLIENINDIPNDDGSKPEFLDRRFAINGYRVDLYDFISNSVGYFNYKSLDESVDSQTRFLRAYNLTNGFFQYVRVTEGRSRRGKSNDGLSADLSRVSAGMGTDGDRWWVELPIFEEPYPVVGNDHLAENAFGRLKLYGETINDAYIAGANYIIENYQWNGELA